MISPERSQLVDNIRIAIAQANDEPSVLKAAVELIDAFSEDFNWTGFYMLKDDKLHVGPYIGPKTDHTVIDLNAGICGAAASKRESVIVDDVLTDSRFLACSLSTRSEIVVPLMDGDQVLGEIDIDSDKPTNFTNEDRLMLEQVAGVVVERLRAIR